MVVFYDDVVGSWASRHDGARQAFAAGGRQGLERAGFVAPAFLPVAATMLVVAAMLVWVLTVFFREGHRWGQLGLFGLVLTGLFASIVLGFVLDPPTVFVAVAVLSLAVEAPAGGVPVAPRHPRLPGRALGRRPRRPPRRPRDHPGDHPGDHSADDPAVTRPTPR